MSAFSFCRQKGWQDVLTAMGSHFSPDMGRGEGLRYFAQAKERVTARFQPFTRRSRSSGVIWGVKVRSAAQFCRTSYGLFQYPTARPAR